MNTPFLQKGTVMSLVTSYSMAPSPVTEGQPNIKTSGRSIPHTHSHTLYTTMSVPFTSPPPLYQQAVDGPAVLRQPHRWCLPLVTERS
jgi:hypothetical protein